MAHRLPNITAPHELSGSTTLQIPHTTWSAVRFHSQGIRRPVRFGLPKHGAGAGGRSWCSRRWRAMKGWRGCCTGCSSPRALAPRALPERASTAWSMASCHLTQPGVPPLPPARPPGGLCCKTHLQSPRRLRTSTILGCSAVLHEECPGVMHNCCVANDLSHYLVCRNHHCGLQEAGCNPNPCGCWV